MTLELSYSHNQTNQTLSRKCSICNDSKKCNLIKLPDKPFQEFAKKKGFESWYCSTTCQVVNFLI